MAQINKSGLGKELERSISDSFDAYYRGGICWMMRMPEPMRTVRAKGRTFNVRTGKAPYDFFGYTLNGAVSIGLEAKQSADWTTSLPILKPDKDGRGIKWHQLEALATLAQAGGQAYIVWLNGNDYGRLDNQHILRAYDCCLEAIAEDKDIRGTWSISWRCFEKIDYGAVGSRPALLWYKTQEKEHG